MTISYYILYENVLKIKEVKLKFNSLWVRVFYGTVYQLNIV